MQKIYSGSNTAKAPEAFRAAQISGLTVPFSPSAGTGKSVKWPSYGLAVPGSTPTLPDLEGADKMA
jgi:hypothetical protein